MHMDDPDSELGYDPDHYTDQLADETEYDDLADDPLHRPTVASMSDETADAVRAEMDRREAAGLPAVPEMHWED
ncbi:hypothetical protein [Streptomyces sp. Je 1-369]|uniref:hypothetical protein n=1 Tax=Streptomyces sp. Je 1-369 TaxID=2966192 RepID=UPI0022858FC8|nr:hypothetical protein [Streptomyces sp. Je 1-369]WAL93980.1 hypothetical protein NOO62_05375 [Streptomyces sp. Je 1-369]